MYFRIIEEIGFRAGEQSPTLISSLLTLLRDNDVTVVKQSIVSGINLFSSCFEEMILQVCTCSFYVLVCIKLVVFITVMDLV